jgi:hypothetical protein
MELTIFNRTWVFVDYDADADADADDDDGGGDDNDNDDEHDDDYSLLLGPIIGLTLQVFNTLPFYSCYIKSLIFFYFTDEWTIQQWISTRHGSNTTHLGCPSPGYDALSTNHCLATTHVWWPTTRYDMCRSTTTGSFI